MSSQRRIDSSRANGAHSQGPVSIEGKARSAQNARKHSLTANTVVLSNEDHDAFVTLFERYHAHFAPQDPLQEDLIEEMAVAKWRQRRIWNVETAVIDHEMDEQEEKLNAEFSEIDECTRLALAVKSLTDHSKLLPNLSRYENRHRRAYEKALHILQNEQNKIGKNEPNPIPGQQAA
jgi:hypothetical protein